FSCTMDLRYLCVLGLAFQVFSAVESSMVKIVDGGYEDIVIAINPQLEENEKIIEKIQDMVKEATGYLFNATKKRLFIRSVKILIPITWSNKNYTRRGTESYGNVSGTELYDPYTLQYGRCEEPGRYIHLTPNFLLYDNMTSVYGPRGRVFVHEWAHLRWGVFDEYNNEKPYYLSRELKVEATRCTTDIFGENIKNSGNCQGNSCSVTYCLFDSNTGLYEEGCVFVPEKNQFVKESIMYLQALPSVSEFCDENNHNIEAPTLQNRMCNSRSTWDVIKNSIDINSTSPLNITNVPVPTFSLLQYKDRVITLVLDISGSMATDGRIGRLYQAAELFVMQIIETGSYVGIVTFETSAYIKSELVQITSEEQRETLISLLPKVASGGTNICPGILKGIEVNSKRDGSALGSEIVLLSDGEDNGGDVAVRSCFPAIRSSGVKVHFIALGPLAALSLGEIIIETGGKHLLSSDKVDGNGLIDAFSSISAENGDISQTIIQLESIGQSLISKECLNGTVYIDQTVGNNTFFLVTWQTGVPFISLKKPNGTLYDATHFTSDTTAKSSRLQIPGTAETGPWSYSLCNTGTSAQVVGLVVNSMLVDVNVPPVTVNAHMNIEKNEYPNPMVVYASVSQGMVPVTGVNVTATIETAAGISDEFELLDNGAGADIVKDDGIYSRYFTNFTSSGRYSLKVRVEGKKDKSRLVIPSSRAKYLQGYTENGSVIMNAPRPVVSDNELNIGSFSRTASGGAFEVLNFIPGETLDIYKPEKITDLAAKIEEKTIVLSWTATGDDFDKGTASEYDLRMSADLVDLRFNFSVSTPVNISLMTPQPAGSSETFTFVPENIVIKNGTILYFAIVAIDKVLQISDLSNIAQASLFIPRTPDSTVPTTTTPTTTQSNRLTSTNSGSKQVSLISWWLERN
uniref:VWFA domain-containing protein n=1 Tax=Leptobrachium leishanense TaxID=445787 RepID=A0A8C5R811_9ANUR